jgi:tRNA-binding EMAP/Myf-like protein
MSDSSADEASAVPACPSCGGEGFDDGDGGYMCGDCGEEYSGSSKYKNYVIGVIVSVEEVRKKKLKVVEVDVGGEDVVKVVTSAKHVAVDERVVVALPGACVPSSATLEECEDEDEEDSCVVKACSVGGVKSGGMLCDAWMLGWGSSKGVRVVLPDIDDCAVGGTPPTEQPR